MRRQMPPGDQIREALEKALASETFSRSGRARDLLRYLVKREQEGQAERLKGFAIALDVFGRDSEFDPATDAVVRVQAGRLRELLEHYYAGEGSGEPVRIHVARGTYVPSYETAPPAEGQASGAPPPAEAAPPATPAPVVDQAETLRQAQRRKVNTHLRLFWGAIAVMIAMLGYVAYQTSWLQPAGNGSPASASQPAGAEAQAARMSSGLPEIYIRARGSDPAVARLEATFRNALAGFDTVEFIARDYSEPEDPRRAGTSFLFVVEPGDGEGAVRVELHDAAQSRVLFARNIPADSPDDAVADILSTVVPASGAIYAFLSASGLETPLTSCLLLNDGYYREPSPEQHRLAYECFEELAGQDSRSPLVYSELAVLHMRTIANRYPYPEGAEREQAVQLVRRAIQFGPASPYAHRANGYLLQRLGDGEESIRWMKAAYELNTYDLSMAAAYAYALIFAGDYAAGRPIMERAVLASSAHPAWWDYALFLAEFMEGDMDKAARASIGFAPVMRGHYLAARAILAHHEGRQDETDALIAQLWARYERLASDPRAFYEEASYPPDMTDRLVAALRAAGLISGS